MIIILGLIILVAALIVGMAGVLGNGGSAHAVSHFSVLGYHLTGSAGTLFLAGIVGQIPQLRSNVRAAFRRSSFRDETGFVRALEAAFREMWRRWCAGEDPRAVRKAG